MRPREDDLGPGDGHTLEVDTGDGNRGVVWSYHGSSSGRQGTDGTSGRPPVPGCTWSTPIGSRVVEEEDLKSTQPSWLWVDQVDVWVSWVEEVGGTGVS